MQASDPWDNPLHERYKTQPVINDPDYPHYVDLNDFIRGFATTEAKSILDYGAGASPYRKYFPNSVYRRADITGADNLDYHIRPDSTIPEKDGTFDLIISTQVAEHVSNPEVYFSECFRLLKEGGSLMITTHGIWEEHGSPNDFQRWTANGLSRDLIQTGFRDPRIFKITNGMRAILLFFSRVLFASTPPPTFPNRLLFKAFRLFYSKVYPSLYSLADRWWPDDRISEVRNSNPEPVWYVVIAAIAMK